LIKKIYPTDDLARPLQYRWTESKKKECVMANKSLFKSTIGKLLPKANARNREGAPAYVYEPRHKLAQLAMTGTLSQTFYAEPRQQLEDVLATAALVEPRFLAQAAIYARRKGHMKDMPALLLAALSARDPVLLTRAFPRVVDNGRMLRTFVQIMRSGATGRKSLGSRPKALVQAWLNQATDAQILRSAVGQSPSLADVIKMVHPKPAHDQRAALYAYLIGKPYDVALVPDAVRAFEAFKRDASQPMPDVPFQMLTALELSPEHWAQIARKAGWQMLRMNLNTFDRHCVFALPGFAEMVASRLRDEAEIGKARVLPYQLMAAYLAASKDVPGIVREALQDAMEIAIANVPEVKGHVVVCPDVSGSMSSPVTGARKGATSAVRCIDVAALVAAAMLRANTTTRVLPFEQSVVDVALNPRDSVVTNAGRLAAIGGGGTSCSAPLAQLNKEKAKVDLVVFISDNESWVDAGRSVSTATMHEWSAIKARNPAAKLVCIDIQPHGTTQAAGREDILNVGGFSDAVFEIVAAFAAGTLGPQHWVGEIEKIEV
jgi:60 kDa SS-A/Ro ribonucleoprotein